MPNDSPLLVFVSLSVNVSKRDVDKCSIHPYTRPSGKSLYTCPQILPGGNLPESILKPLKTGKESNWTSKLSYGFEPSFS